MKYIRCIIYCYHIRPHIRPSIFYNEHTSSVSRNAWILNCYIRIEEKSAEKRNERRREGKKEKLEFNSCEKKKKPEGLGNARLLIYSTNRYNIYRNVHRAKSRQIIVHMINRVDSIITYLFDEGEKKKKKKKK